MDNEDRSLIGAAVETKFGNSSGMFEAAVSKFVKTVGKESLVGVPNLDEANRCQPFQVVVKKNRRWFWQSPKYETTPFQLHQLLVTPEQFTDVKVTSRPLTTYNKTYEFDVNGKTGAKLLSLFDFEVDGSDVIAVEAKFGNIVKREVDQPAFLEQVEKRSIDIKHEFLQQVRTDPRKVLCVVVGSAQLEADGTVHMHTARSGEAKEDAGNIAPKVTDEEVDVSVGDKADNKLVLPKGTPVAYNLCELAVKEDGSLELMVERDALGGFQDTMDSVDGSYEEGILEGMSVEEQFRPLVELSRDDRQDFSSAVLNICGTPADIDTVLVMLKEGQRKAGSDEVRPVEVKGQVADVHEVLKVAGFQVKDDGSVVYPKEKTALLDVVRTVFEALAELDDMEALALRRCNKNHAPALLHMLSSALDQSAMTIGDKELLLVYKEPGVAQAFAQTLGYQVSTDGSVTAADDNQAELEGAYRAVYALWWEEKTPAPGSAFRCVIL